MVRNRSPGSSGEWRFRRRRLQPRLEQAEGEEVAAVVVAEEVAERALRRVVLHLRPALHQQVARAAELRAELPLLPVQVLPQALQQVRVPHREASKVAEVVEPPVAGEVEPGVVQRYPQCRRPPCNVWTCAQRAG